MICVCSSHGFKGRQSLHPRKTEKPLRKQGPENASGSFDPDDPCQTLRSPSAYSLPSSSDSAGFGQARRVPFAGRSSTHPRMDELDTTTNGQAAEHFSSTAVAQPFDAVDTENLEASNRKPQDGKGVLTHLTDLTALEMGVYVTPARPLALARSRSPEHLPAPSTTAVKSVKSVKPQDGKGVFSPPCRQTGCQFDGTAVSGVVA